MTSNGVQPLLYQSGNSGMLYDGSMGVTPGLRLFDPAFYQGRAQAVSEGGRNAAWFIQDTWGQGVLRKYRRGGLVARLNKTSYLWRGAEQTRSFAEFRLLQYMHDRGLPVPKVVAACYTRSVCSYRAAIITERLVNTTPLASVLKQMPASHDTQSLARACAESIRQMHQANVWHADLNAFNILIDSNGKAWLIDFDKGKQTVMSPSLCQGNLNRLKRSLEKILQERGLAFWEQLNRIYSQIQ